MKSEGKAVSGIMLTLLLIFMMTLAFGVRPAKAEPTTWTVDDDGPADFHAIQEGINVADPGDTVYVKAGTYYEHLILSESLTLKGESATSTIIDGSSKIGYTIDVEADDVTIEGFTIRNGTGLGMWFSSPDNCKIIGNTIIGNKYGIYLSGGQGNGLYKNTITANEENGVLIVNSENNLVTENTISNNKRIGIYIPNPGNCIIYHNNFINNGQNAYSQSANTWDDGYPSGGNYWSDYTGVDLYGGPNQDYPSGSDGIGDSPYLIDETNQDRYPLTSPWIERTVGVKAGDWARYKYEFEWSSTDPNERPPEDLVDIVTHMEWYEIEVLEVYDTTVTFQTIGYFDNGTETKSYWTVDVNDGSGNGTYLIAFIAASLNPGEALCTFPPKFMWCGWRVEETILRPYAGMTRETNHLNVTDWSFIGRDLPLEFDSVDDFYWDRATGILSEHSHQQRFESDGYVTSLSLTMKIVDNNLWKNQFPEDQNHDGKVDIRDIAMAALAFGSYVGHSKWNPHADINHDGKIDIRDLVIIAKSFGKTYP